jgi:hypothetical protein
VSLNASRGKGQSNERDGKILHGSFLEFQAKGSHCRKRAGKTGIIDYRKGAILTDPIPRPIDLVLTVHGDNGAGDGSFLQSVEWRLSPI